MFALILSYILLYKYVAIFVIVFSAAIIVPWPINTMLLAIGAFSDQGYFNFLASFFVVLIANVAGDLSGYWLTRKYGQTVIKNFHAKHTAHFLRFEKYIKTHAGITIFFSRFVGIFQVVVNFLSGLVRVPLRKFIIFDIFGNATEIFLVLALGYVVGSSWQNFTNLLSIGTGIVFVVVLFFFFTRNFYIRKTNRI